MEKSHSLAIPANYNTDTPKLGPSGLKDDHGKLQWHLLPKESLEDIIRVMMYGNLKYEPGNWKFVNDPINRYWDAAQRHMWASREQATDPESGFPHIAHAAASLLFILHFMNHEKN